MSINNNGKRNKYTPIGLRNVCVSMFEPPLDMDEFGSKWLTFHIWPHKTSDPAGLWNRTPAATPGNTARNPSCPPAEFHRSPGCGQSQSYL